MKNGPLGHLQPGNLAGRLLGAGGKLVDALPDCSEIKRHRFDLLMIGRGYGWRDHVGNGLRNGYGRQVHSDVVSGPSTLKPEPMEMVFIRGPIFERVGPDVEVLAEYAGKPALVQKGQILAAAFHPELTNDTTVHQRFLELAAENAARSAMAR